MMSGDATYLRLVRLVIHAGDPLGALELHLDGCGLLQAHEENCLGEAPELVGVRQLAIVRTEHARICPNCPFARKIFSTNTGYEDIFIMDTEYSKFIPEV
jgi:hypothetical protein